jgi:hypothetical protein
MTHEYASRPVDMQEMLTKLQEQQKELERLGEQYEEMDARFDKDAQMRAAEAIQDPLERARAMHDVSRAESDLLTLRQLNAVMQRVLMLEQVTIVLTGRLERVEQSLGP